MILLWGENYGGNFEVITGYLAYPDYEYENLEIEVILPGIEKKNIFFRIAGKSHCQFLKRDTEGNTVLSVAL